MTTSRSESASGVREPSSDGGTSEGCATKTLRFGAKRAISARQFAISDAGTTRRLGSFAALPFFFSNTSSAMTWRVLPSPMSSARHPPRPKFLSHQSHRSPTF